MFSRGLTVFFVAGTLAVGFGGCGDDSAKDPVEVVINQDKDALSEGTREQALQQIRAALNVDIGPDKSLENYASEGAVNRVVRILARRSSDIKDHLKDVSKILVGTTFSGTRVGNSLVITVPVDASERDIIDYIKNQTLDKASSDAFTELAAKVKFASLTDKVGLTYDQVKALSDKLTNATKLIDLSKMPLNVLIADRFTVDTNGTVTINFEASQDEMAAFFKSSVDVLRQSVEVLKAVNEQLVGIKIVIQGGTFSPDELKTALTNLAANVDSFKAADRLITTIYIGKRFESDTLKKKKNLTALVDYRVTGNDLITHLSDYDRDFSQEIAIAITTLKGMYKDSAIAVNESAVLNSELANQKIIAVSAEMLKVMPAPRAYAIGIRTINVQFTETKPSASLSGSTVTISVMSFDPNELERVLVDAEVQIKNARNNEREAASKAEEARLRASAEIGRENDRLKAEAEKAKLEAAREKLENEKLAKENERLRGGGTNPPTTPPTNPPVNPPVNPTSNGYYYR